MRPWLGLLSQDTRLIEIHGPPAGELVVERFAGSEAVCDDFELTIDCVGVGVGVAGRPVAARPPIDPAPAPG